MSQMNVVVRQSELKSALNYLHRIAVTKNNPDVLLQVSGDTMSISVSQSGQGGSYHIEATGEEGSALLNLKSLEEFVSTLPFDDVTLRVTSNVCTITAHRMRGRFPLADNELYTPAVTKHDDNLVPVLSINAQEFRDIIRDIAPAAASSSRAQGREYFTCILLHPLSDGIDFVCTDGILMAHTKYTGAHNLNERVLIPAEGLKNFAGAIGKDEGNVTLRLSKNGNIVVLSVADSDFFTTTMEGKFPQYAAAYPATYSLTVDILTDNFLNAVASCQSCGSDRIILDTGEMLQAHAATEMGETEIELENARVSGPAIRLILPVSYLSEILRQVKSQQFSIKCDPVGARKTIVLTPKGEEQLRYSMMPLFDASLAG